MPVNLSKPPKKRIIKNKIFIIILILYISFTYTLNYIYPRMTLYIIITLGIIGFILMMDGLSRYIDYEKSKYKKN